MARYLICTSCRLSPRICRCRQEASTSGNANDDENIEKEFKLTPASTRVFSLIFGLIHTVLFTLLLKFIFHYHRACHLKVFLNTFSIPNASNATADWNVGFEVNTPGDACKASLHSINSLLFRGDKLISESSLPDYFGKLVTRKLDERLSYAVFETVATPPLGVVWDLRVEVVFSVKINGRRSNIDYKDGFLMVKCDGIPVNFAMGLDGNVKGSLLGSKRLCAYVYRAEYWDPTF